MDGFESVALFLVGVGVGFGAGLAHVRLLQFWRRFSYRPSLLHRFDPNRSEFGPDN